MNFINRISVVVLLIVLFTTTNSEGAKLFVKERYVSKDTIQFIQRQKELDRIYSDKKLGSFLENGRTVFRLFAPSAIEVKLLTFKKVDSERSKDYSMTKDENGVWEVIIDGDLCGTFYGYKVFHVGDDLKSEKPLCIDPYSKSVATFTTYRNPRKSIVYNKEYNWEGDTWIQRDWRDLIIYEMHVRDMTIHPSSGVKEKGTYKGLVEKKRTGGLEYLKTLGVNTVELLPAHDFGYIELPYKDSVAGQFNTWNPYERNHWGYMTAAFFAPASYYSQKTKELKWNKWMGTDSKQVTDFKDMVKGLHKEGIGVMMDVVYNHLSEYEIGNLKEIDKEYYFRLDNKGNCLAVSGCGNDLKTERKMTRRLIIESILYWMKEYHIDGFRFDLGKLIDWETIEDIIHEAKKINPSVVFVCEPWGGGYDPQGFSLRGWGAWNDQIRNGIKGENPFTDLGWIFGKWQGNNNPTRIKSYVNGTLMRDSLGLFMKKEHSVNYLESHDGYTLGDFIRLGLNDVAPDQIIKNRDKNAKLTPIQLKLNKLGALFLFTSQGMTMIHSGQEYARSKVIPHNLKINDEHKGRLDHNSYNKDNETNYINYKHAAVNKELFDYYKGLIQLRKTYGAFRHAEYDQIKFGDSKETPFAFGYLLEHEGNTFIVAFNADKEKSVSFDLPKGEWQVLVNKDKAGIETINNVFLKIDLDPSTGMVLKKKN